MIGILSLRDILDRCDRLNVPIFEGLGNPTLIGLANRGTLDPSHQYGRWDDEGLVIMPDPSGDLAELLQPTEAELGLWLVDRLDGLTVLRLEYTTDPGLAPMRKPTNRIGVARVEARNAANLGDEVGVYRSCWGLGYHGQSKVGFKNPALRQIGRMAYRRNVRTDDVYEGGPLLWGEANGFNDHPAWKDGLGDDGVDYASEGCQVGRSRRAHRLRMMLLWATAGGLGAPIAWEHYGSFWTAAEERARISALSKVIGRSWGSRFSYALIDVGDVG